MDGAGNGATEGEGAKRAGMFGNGVELVWEDGEGAVMLGKGAGCAVTDKNGAGCAGVGAGCAATDGEGAREEAGNGATDGKDGKDAARAGCAAMPESGSGVDVEGAGNGATEETERECTAILGESSARAGSRRGGGRRTLGRPEPDGCGRAGGRAGASLRVGRADWRRVRALVAWRCWVVRISGAPATLAGCVDTSGRGSRL